MMVSDYEKREAGVAAIYIEDKNSDNQKNN